MTFHIIQLFQNNAATFFNKICVNAKRVLCFGLYVCIDKFNPLGFSVQVLCEINCRKIDGFILT